ncbi:MAG: transcriptional repressor [Limnochordales bacterium]|nr:MAG: transcriptional repressor [Bacillota bacterium]HLT59452.1 transcriptional repressor [Limnochordales bacterium]
MTRTRNTRQKMAVLAAVRRAPHHPDARWVYNEVSQEIPDISLGTVYRALAALSAEGLIREYRQADGPTLYDSNTDDHSHIRCRRCGRIEDVPAVGLPDRVLEAIREASGFARVDQVFLEFGGVCARCAQRSRGPEALRPDPGQR